MQKHTTLLINTKWWKIQQWLSPWLVCSVPSHYLNKDRKKWLNIEWTHDIHFSEICIKLQQKTYFKMLSAKTDICQTFCLGLNVWSTYCTHYEIQDNWLHISWLRRPQKQLLFIIRYLQGWLPMAIWQMPIYWPDIYAPQLSTTIGCHLGPSAFAVRS